MAKSGRTWADLIHENRWIFIIILIVLIGLAIFKIPSKIGPLELGTQPLAADTIKNNQHNITGGQNNVNGNNNVNGSNNINNAYFIQQPLVNQNDYSFTGTKNSRLIKKIENSKKITVVKTSKKHISITYTGTITALGENTNGYYYSGGNVAIIVNDNCIHEFEEFKIEEMRPNSKSQITQEIDNIINKYIDSNIELFFNKIIECIK